MVAQVAVARFADRQPLYHQAQIMTRQGATLDRSTLASWMGYAAARGRAISGSCGEAAWAQEAEICTQVPLP